ncbi:hypothetical protein AK83_00015 [Streptococcus pneumoniae K2527]|nr:hypothetical protein AK83_00015 [Streptococcus pneumoniae K2527]
MPIRKTIVKSAFEDANKLYEKMASCYAKSSMLLMKLISIALKIVIRLMIFTKKFLKIFKMLGTQENFIRHVQRLIFIAKFLTQKLGESMADLACGTGGFLTSTLNRLSSQRKTSEDTKKYNTGCFWY